MQISYNKEHGFLRGKSLKKPTEYQVSKQATQKGFDISDFEYWYHDSEGLYRFKAYIIPSKQITKNIENEILERLDILFQRKQYTKEEQNELKRLVWK